MRLYKFRKFHPLAGDAGPGVTVRGDVRLTPIGRFLERTKMDRLPQFVNVLKGEITIVRPRPESLRFQHLFQGPYREVLNFVPVSLVPAKSSIAMKQTFIHPTRTQKSFTRQSFFLKKHETISLIFERRRFSRTCSGSSKEFPSRCWEHDFGRARKKAYQGLPSAGRRSRATRACKA